MEISRIVPTSGDFADSMESPERLLEEEKKLCQMLEENKKRQRDAMGKRYKDIPMDVLTEVARNRGFKLVRLEGKRERKVRMYDDKGIMNGRVKAHVEKGLCGMWKKGGWFKFCGKSAPPNLTVQFPHKKDIIGVCQECFSGVNV